MRTWDISPDMAYWLKQGAMVVLCVDDRNQPPEYIRQVEYNHWYVLEGIKPFPDENQNFYLLKGFPNVFDSKRFCMLKTRSSFN